jgi:outer membrane usher protein
MTLLTPLFPQSEQPSRSLRLLACFLSTLLLLPFPVTADTTKAVVACKPSVNSLATLNQVTYLTTLDYTYITLELDRTVTWLARKLAPEKDQKTGLIYIDLTHVRLGRSARNLTIHDQVIERVRLGQYKPDVVRVVLDTKNFNRYKIYPLEDPARLIIYVWEERTSTITRQAPPGNLPQPAEAKQTVPAPNVAIASPPGSSATSNRETDKGHKNAVIKNGNGHSEPLLLDVTVNSQRLPEIVLAEKLGDGRLALPEDTWQAARLRPPAGGLLSLSNNRSGYMLESVPGLTYNLDRATLALTITAPAAAFTGSDIDRGRGGESPPNLSPPGFYLNYDFSATSVDRHYSSYGALVEGVAFNRWGSAVAGMILRGDQQRNEAIRSETFLRKDLPGPMETLVLGDTIGVGGAWSRPVRYGGIRWSRDFTLRPGFITTPMPSLSGSAALPSTMDIFINNHLQQSTRIAPGPFELTNVPMVSGAGEINLVVHDLLGRETVISQSYYLSPRMLAPGLADFSLEAGALRENYGSKSNDYGEGFAAGTLLYGLTPALTGEAHIELQQKRLATGLALSSLLGTLGVAQAAAAVANADGNLGGHYLLSLERSSPRGGASLRGEYYDRNFSRFAAQPRESRPRQQFSASIGKRLLEKVSVGISYTGQSTWEGDRFSMASVSLGVTLPWDMNLSAIVSKRLDSGFEWSGSAVLSMSLDNQRTASAGTSRKNDGHTVNTAEMSQSLPPGPGLGWRLRASDDSTRQWEAGVAWNTNSGNINVEATDSMNFPALRLGASGSVGWLEGLPFASRSIGQGSFAVVKVGDLPDVPVYRSNQLAAATNSSGLALVPGLLPYQNNQLTIDPAELPFDIEIRGVKETALPYARSGVLVEFPVRRSRNALVLLYQPDGTPVPAGARVTIVPGERQFLVGKRGEVYLMDLTDSNQALVKWQGGACHLGISLDPKGPSEPRIGPLICGGKS